MVLETVISFIYQTVSHTWAVATVALKFILVLYVVELARRRDINFESFMEIVEDLARETVLVMILLGAVFANVGVEPEPLIPVVGEAVALGYFALLFWRY